MGILILAATNFQINFLVKEGQLNFCNGPTIWSTLYCRLHLQFAIKTCLKITGMISFNIINDKYMVLHTEDE